jgi:hypothetical protein
MTDFYKYVIFFGTCCIFISFIGSLIIMKDRRPYIRYFFIGPLIALLASANAIFSIFLSLYGEVSRYFLQSILFFLELSFWTFFFLKIIQGFKDKKQIRVLFFIVVFLSCLLQYFNTFSYPNIHIMGLHNVCKTLFCIIYYRTLFKNFYHKNLVEEPMFWIVTGLFFYSSLSIPFYALNSYIKTNFTFEIGNNIFTISNCLIIVMHTFFIKAYLCIAHQHKV